MGFLIEWDDPNITEDGHRLYRSTSPMDPQNMPAPIAELGPDVVQYEDGDVTPGLTYFYRVGAYIGSVEMLSDELEIDAVELAVIPRRFWRVLFTEAYPTSGFFFWISRLRLRDVVGGTDIAPVSGGVPTASTRHDSGFDADKAFDGLATTGWSPSSGAAPPQWLQYEFPSPVAILQLGIQAGDSTTRAKRGPKSFILQSSEDGTSWENILEITGEAMWAVSETRFYEV